MQNFSAFPWIACIQKWEKCVFKYPKVGEHESWKDIGVEGGGAQMGSFAKRGGGVKFY